MDWRRGKKFFKVIKKDFSYLMLTFNTEKVKKKKTRYQFPLKILMTRWCWAWIILFLINENYNSQSKLKLTWNRWKFCRNIKIIFFSTCNFYHQFGNWWNINYFFVNSLFRRYTNMYNAGKLTKIKIWNHSSINER